MRLQDLESNLDTDLSWRKNELSSLFEIALNTKIASEEGHDNLLYKTVLKTLYLLLYSHWEGFVKKSCKLYISYINQKNVRASDLTNTFTALALKKSINTCYTKENIDSLSIKTYLDFIDLHNSKLQENFKVIVKTDSDFDDDFIKTFSNLTYKNYKNLLTSIDLPVFEYFYHENYHIEVEDVSGKKQNVPVLSSILDFSLLHYRHSIAHSGSVSNELDLEVYQILQEKILYIMDMLVTNISDFCHEEFYKQCNFNQRNKYIEEKNEEIKQYFMNLNSTLNGPPEEFLDD